MPFHDGNVNFLEQGTLLHDENDAFSTAETIWLCSILVPTLNQVTEDVTEFLSRLGCSASSALAQTYERNDVGLVLVDTSSQEESEDNETHLGLPTNTDDSRESLHESPI
jgi:hypothetical protein